MPGWSDRVRFAGGDKGFAYAPGRVLVKTVELTAARDLLGLSAPDGQTPTVGSYSVLPVSGEVPSVVASLRGAGLTAQPDYVYFLDAAPNADAAGNPVYASPVYASPVYASPVYASPVYASGADPHATAHCRDTNPCTCEPPASASSLVYPHPIFAKLRYTPQGALRYQMTGTRPSQAKPLYGVQAPGPTDAGWATTGVVRIAVVDTGWPASGALATVASTSEGDFIDAPDAEFDGYLDPVAGHGTFIAGLLAQRAPDCAVAVFHALSTYGDGAESAIATCIQDLACRPSETRPHFLSLSFGTYTPDDEEPGVLREAIQHAILKGIIVVASAGNDGTSRRSYPAAFPGVVSVGALGPSGPASFSNWGDWVRACAPGVDVSSSFWFFNGAQQAKFGADADDYHGWALWSGTSFAAPIVTAALADAVHHGVPIKEVVSRTIDYPGLYRIPCYGTVVNPPIKQLGKLP